MPNFLPRTFAAAVMLLALTGCNQSNIIDNWSKQDAANARNYVELLRQKKFDQIQADMDSSIVNDSTPDTLTKMSEMFPLGEPISIKTVGWHKFTRNGVSTVSTTLEYELPQHWELVDFTTENNDGATKITGFHLQPLAESLEQRNKFTLSGKTAEQYMVLLFTIAMPLLSIYAFILCVRTRIEKRKWLWLIFIALGVGQYGVNWTTGAPMINIFTITLLSAGTKAALYGPWFIYTSIPLGALIFLYRRPAISRSNPAPKSPILM